MNIKFLKSISNLVSYDIRYEEYNIAFNYLSKSKNVLDLGCGTGTFLNYWSDRSNESKTSIIGIDLNEENVLFGKKKGLNIIQGNALDLPFENDSFDAIHSSHLMQVFSPIEAQKFFSECLRVTKNNGIIVLSTLNWFPRFFRHPENLRPYPPDAILRYTNSQIGSTSPMFKKMRGFTQESIWFRRPPLIELYNLRYPNLDSVCFRLNQLQLKLRLRKFWTFDSYIIKLRVKD